MAALFFIDKAPEQSMPEVRGCTMAPARSMVMIAMLASMSPVTAHAQSSAAPKFRDAVAQAQGRLAKGDLSSASAYISGLSPATPLEKYMAASLAMELATKRGDVLAQRKAIAHVIESGAAPEGQMGALNRVAGYLSYQTGAIDNAVVYLARARALGENDPQTGLMLVESYVRQRKQGEAGALLDAVITGQIAAGQTVPSSWYDRASALAYARKDWAGFAKNSAGKLSSASMTGPDWRGATAAYMAGAAPENEAQLDLYRLQAATDALASERDYQAYATLAAGQGYAAEAKALVEAGQSRGKLSKNDPVALSLTKTLKTKAVVNLAAIKLLPGKVGSVASGTKAAQNGDALLANSQFSEAVPYYRAALEKGGVDRDRVTTRLGIALARSGDLAGAQATLAQAKGRWGQVAVYWSAWVASRRTRTAESAALQPAS